MKIMFMTEIGDDMLKTSQIDRNRSHMLSCHTSSGKTHLVHIIKSEELFTDIFHKQKDCVSH